MIKHVRTVSQIDLVFDAQASSYFVVHSSARTKTCRVANFCKAI